MSLVHSPRCLDWNPHQVQLIKNYPERSDSSFQNGRERPIEGIAVRFEEAPGFQSFVPPALGEVDVRPAGEPIFLIPHALAMPQQD